MNLFHRRGPLPASVWPALSQNPRPDAGLLCSLDEEQRYDAEIEGTIPAGLRGSLYRNGPGKFDRGATRKRMMLDGDGLVQAFHFREQSVEYLARFPQTKKFVAEEAAGKFLYPTWSTLAPGFTLRNVGAKIPNQAGITVLRAGDALLAFDEGQVPFRLNPQSLDSLGEIPVGEDGSLVSVHAHWKWDTQSEGWATLSMEFGRQAAAVIHYFKKDATRAYRQQRITLPRSVYVHDWFLTKSHVVILLHPAFVSLKTFAKVWLGVGTFAESVDWRPEKGNTLCVASRNGGPPKIYETESEYMWHSVNGYETADELVLDFVGNREGGGLGTEHSAFFQLMRGESPSLPAEPHTRLVRYRLNLRNSEIKTESLLASGDYEMPYVRAAERAVAHRSSFLAESDLGEIFWSAVLRRDESGTVDRYHFGKNVYCTEPVWAPDADRGPGWILTEVYDSKPKKSRLDILRADRIAEGPVASVKLRHHVPLSFHGVFY